MRWRRAITSTRRPPPGSRPTRRTPSCGPVRSRAGWPDQEGQDLFLRQRRMGPLPHNDREQRHRAHRRVQNRHLRLQRAAGQPGQSFIGKQRARSSARSNHAEDTLPVSANPNGPAIDSIRALYFFPTATPQNSANVTFKVDHHFTDKYRFSRRATSTMAILHKTQHLTPFRASEASLRHPKPTTEA